LKHSEFRNLNPYAVLKLDIDATVDDVKMRYRKLSALCHPDKNLGDQERARVAFEALKTAHQTLLDPKLRDRTILVVQGARDRARQSFTQSNVTTSEEEFTEKEVMKTFAQNEMKRRDVEEHKRVYAAREKAQQDLEKKKVEEEKKFEHEWNEDDRRNARINFWQQFQDDAERAGAQKRLRTAKNFKQQQASSLGAKPKYGDVQLEAWRKDWK